MSLYLVKSIDEIPIGTEYRILGENLDYWDGKHLVETKEELKDLEVAPDTFPNGVSTDPQNCIVEWCNKTTIDPVDQLVGISDETIMAAIEARNLDSAVAEKYALKIGPRIEPIKPNIAPLAEEG